MIQSKSDIKSVDRILPSHVKFLTTQELSRYLNLGIHKLVIIKQVVPLTNDMNANTILFSGGIYVTPRLIAKLESFEVPNPQKPFFLVGELLPYRFPPLTLKAYSLDKLESMVDLSTLLTKKGTGFLVSTFPYDKALFDSFMYYQLYSGIASIARYNKQLQNQETCSMLFNSPISNRTVQFYFNGIKITPGVDFTFSSLPVYVELKFPCKLTGTISCYTYETC